MRPCESPRHEQQAGVLPSAGSWPGRLGGRGAGNPAGARWASRRDLGSVRVHGTTRSRRLVLGRFHGWAATRNLVATEARHSVLVLGPTQSGKTSGLAIPA